MKIEEVKQGVYRLYYTKDGQDFIVLLDESTLALVLVAAEEGRKDAFSELRKLVGCE
jgi:hypothetical protein